MAGVVEQRSIDVVPDDERHGSAVSQFTLWLGANLQITAVITGALAVVFGANAFWSLIGLLLGNLLGGAVMALHSAQGPRLGLPQMITSRAQFGVRGAVVPLALVIVMYIGFFASGSVLAGQAVGELTHLGETPGIVLFAAVTAVAAAVGYRLIHTLGKIAGLVCALAFVYLGIRLLQRADLGALLADHRFGLPVFLLAVSLSASWQLAFGPYVADYSRYLPRHTSARATFWWTLVRHRPRLAVVDDVRRPRRRRGRRRLRRARGRLRRRPRRRRPDRLAPVLRHRPRQADHQRPQHLRRLHVAGDQRQRLPRAAHPLPRGRAAYIAGIMVAGTAVALLGQGLVPDLLQGLPALPADLLHALVGDQPRRLLPDLQGALRHPGAERPRRPLRCLERPGAGRLRLGVLAQLPFLATHFYTGPLVAPLGGAISPGSSGSPYRPSCTGSSPAATPRASPAPATAPRERPAAAGSGG